MEKVEIGTPQPESVADSTILKHFRVWICRC